MKDTACLLWLLGLLLALAQNPLALAQNGTNTVVVQLERTEQPLRYFMEFQVADQTMKGLLDTGSSDLTVLQANSEICKLELQQCDDSGKTGFKTGALDLNQGNQNEIKEVGKELNATFTGGAGFQGEFINAPFRASPDSKPINLQMGLVKSGNPPSEDDPVFSVIGIGPVQGESTTNENPDDTYLNMPARLKKDGVIKSNAFGLSLGGAQPNDNGSLIFGGFDKARMEGPFVQVPLEPVGNGDIPSFVVNFSSVRMTSAGERAQGGGQGGGQGRNKDGGSEKQSSEGRGGQGSKQQSGQGQGNGRGNDKQKKADRNRKVASSANNKRRAALTRRATKDRVMPGPKRSYQHVKRSSLSRRQRQQDGNILSDELPPVVLVDSGAPGIILPEQTVQAIAEELGTEITQDGTLGPVERGRLQGMALAFGMGDDAAQISVPLESMVTPPGPVANGNQALKEEAKKSGGDGQAERGRNGRRSAAGSAGYQSQKRQSNNGGQSGGNGGGETVELPIFVGSADDPGGIAVLGAPPMQRMYIVFDMDAQALMIAPAKTGDVQPDIQEYVSPGKGGGGGGGCGGQGDDKSQGGGQGGGKGQGGQGGGKEGAAKATQRNKKSGSGNGRDGAGERGKTQFGGGRRGRGQGNGNGEAGGRSGRQQ